jgi:hypothetical protein
MIGMQLLWGILSVRWTQWLLWGLYGCQGGIVTVLHSGCPTQWLSNTVAVLQTTLQSISGGRACTHRRKHLASAGALDHGTGHSEAGAFSYIVQAPTTAAGLQGGRNHGNEQCIM